MTDSECSFVAADISNVSITFSENQSNVALNAVLEFVECKNDVCKWTSNNEPKYCSEPETGVPIKNEQSVKGEFLFSLPFKNTFQRSTYIELNSSNMSAMVNGGVALKILTQTDQTVMNGKQKEIVKVDDVYINIFVPFAALFATKGCAISAEGNIEELQMKLPSCVITSNKPSVILSKSNISFRVACDNDMAEYLLGCSVFRWEGAACNTIPSTNWSLKAPDVVDPKAKVQPTAEDLRKKYLDNIAKLLASQGDQLKLDINVGKCPDATEESAAETENTVVSPPQIGDMIPPLSLGNGAVVFNTSAAGEASIEEDIRARTDLWSMTWDHCVQGVASEWCFYHRTDWLKMKLFFQQEQESGTGDAVLLPVVVTKSIGAVAGDNVPCTASGNADLTAMQAPGCTRGQITVRLDAFTENGEPYPPAAVVSESTETGEGDAAQVQTTTAAIEPPICDLVLHFSCSRPLVNDNPTESGDAPSEGRLITGNNITSKPVNRDVKEELRDEIVSIVRQIALEYVALYPTAGANANNKEPKESKNPQNESASTGSGNSSAEIDRKAEFMYYLSSSGVYHIMKERLKPRIQRVVRDMYGVRGRAKNPSSQFLPAEGFEDESDIPIEALLGELYVYLIKETNTVMNEMYESTVVKRDMMEIEKPNTIPSKANVIDDENETMIQAFERNLQMAFNAEADERYWVAEQYHLERIQMVKNYALFQGNTTFAHGAYVEFGHFMQRRSAWTLLLAKACNSDTNALSSTIMSPTRQGGAAVVESTAASMYYEDAQYFTSRARQALDLALKVDPDSYQTSLLLASILLEAGEYEQAEVVLITMFNRLLGKTASSPTYSKSLTGIFSLDDFDGYDTDQLVGNEGHIDPQCYTFLAIVFAMRNNALAARKAILMANKCFEKSATSYPPVAEHGKPKRTAVLNLIRSAIYFYEYGLISLGNVAYSLADESDKAVTAKAAARNMFADTVSFVRHLLKKGECYYNLFNNNDLTKALEVANECVFVSKSNIDCCQAWLLVAKVQSICMNDMVALGESYGQAVNAISQESESVGCVESFMLPLHDLLSYAKLLITTGGSKYNDALRILLSEVSIRYTSASLFLYIGICCLRLDRLADAEDALQEANLLENRNPDIWAYLSLFILTTGSMYRLGEAEQALAQAIRLGLSNSNLIRELAISYMAVDKLVIAEDLIRRALAIETGSVNGDAPTGRGNSRTRKLMADILAAQNQAAKAIDEYQSILSDDSIELSVRVSAGERCVVLLSSLGRDEEVKQLNNILTTLRNAIEN